MANAWLFFSFLMASQTFRFSYRLIQAFLISLVLNLIAMAVIVIIINQLKIIGLLIIIVY